MSKLDLIKKIKQSAYLEGDFTTRAGKKTSYYIDKYLFETQPDILNLLANQIQSTISSLSFDLIAAPAFGAVPIASVLSQKIHVPYIIIKHNDKQSPLILGTFHKGQRVVIIEDILTSGKTSLETAQYLNSIELEVISVISVVNREEGGTESLTKNGFDSISLMTSSDLKRA